MVLENDGSAYVWGKAVLGGTGRRRCGLEVGCRKGRIAYKLDFVVCLKHGKISRAIVQTTFTKFWG